MKISMTIDMPNSAGDPPSYAGLDIEYDGVIDEEVDVYKITGEAHDVIAFLTFMITGDVMVAAEMKQILIDGSPREVL